MIDLQQLKILAQLMDNMDIATVRLERAYNDNDAENFNSSRTEIIDIQNKISSIATNKNIIYLSNNSAPYNNNTGRAKVLK